jgi:hypothetical protein
MMRFLVCIFLVSGLVLLPAAAFAAPPAGGGKVIQMEELVVEGKIQKPQVFYVLSRHKIRYEKLQLKKSFMDELVRSVEQKPF